MTSLGAQTAAETAAYDKVRSQPFDKIHGAPSRGDFHNLCKQVIVVLSQPNSCILEHRDTGFVGEVLTNQQFFPLNSQNAPYVTLDDYEEQYDPSIDDAMTDATRKRTEALCGDRRRGCLRGTCQKGASEGHAKTYATLLMKDSTNNWKIRTTSTTRSKSRSTLTILTPYSANSASMASRRQSYTTTAQKRRTSSP